MSSQASQRPSSGSARRLSHDRASFRPFRRSPRCVNRSHDHPAQCAEFDWPVCFKSASAGTRTGGKQPGRLRRFFFLQRGPAIESTLPDVSAESTLGTATEVPPPRPQIQVPPQESLAATLGSCQESPLVPSASEHDASTPEMATERMLAEAMPHYDSGMQALNRFLRLVTDGGQKKR
jgi:hypothetical protein